MSEKQETIADIVAEMRTFKCTNLVTCKQEECTAISKYLADRIEVAQKREIEKCKKYLGKALEALESIYGYEFCSYGTEDVYCECKKFYDELEKGDAK